MTNDHEYAVNMEGLRKDSVLPSKEHGHQSKKLTDAPIVEDIHIVTKTGTNAHASNHNPLVWGQLSSCLQPTSASTFTHVQKESLSGVRQLGRNVLKLLQ